MTHLTDLHTEEERREIRRLLLELYHDPHNRPAPQRAKQTGILLKQAYAEGAPLRDAFGNSRLVMALRTVCLAAAEIGLRGDALTAFVVYAATAPEKGEEMCQTVEKVLGLDTAAALRAILRVKSIESKAETMQTDNFRNLFIAQAGDMRVVLLLIAESVVLMRSIRDTDNTAEQQRVSTEASALFAQLAHKLGLYKLKSELEDLSLKYLEHDAYYLIKDSLNAKKQERDAYIERFMAPIRKMLDEEGLKYHIKGRTKSIHSIWQKMKKQKCGFNGVYDLFAIRIILDAPPKEEKKQCWKVFSLITGQYESNLKRLRDWLTVPKSNGYESLHITVRGPEDKWV